MLNQNMKKFAKKLKSIHNIKYNLLKKHYVNLMNYKDKRLLKKVKLKITIQFKKFINYKQKINNEIFNYFNYKIIKYKIVIII